MKTSLSMGIDDFVKVTDKNGNYRYGYIEKVQEHGNIISVSFYEEGESKIRYDAEQAKVLGYLPADYTGFLSDVEKKVAALLAQCLQNKEIGEQLDISPVTVRAHVRTLRIKLHLENKNQLVAFCQGLKL